MKPIKRDLSRYKAKATTLSTKKTDKEKKALNPKKTNTKIKALTPKKTKTAKRAPPPPRSPTPEPSPEALSQLTFSWLSQPQKDLCTILRKRRFKATLRYSCDDAKRLGIDDCLQQLAQKHGFSKVLNHKEKVYPVLVLEFLSSLKVVSKSGDISFSIGGVKKKMSLKDVNELFEFPVDGTIGPESFKCFCESVNGKQFIAKHFWKEVTSRNDWIVGLTKSFAFVNPAIRILHRFLLQVFYPKGETGQVATNDFRMLWWFVNGDPNTMGQLNFGRFLVAAFIWERDHNSGPITMGSFVTVFAKYVGVDLGSFDALADCPYLDIRQMANHYKWLDINATNNFTWFVKGEGKEAKKIAYAQLPCAPTQLMRSGALLFSPGASSSTSQPVDTPSTDVS